SPRSPTPPTSTLSLHDALPISDNDAWPVVTHELAHLISHGAIHHQPHWFSEGLANFFETVKLDASATTGELGNPVPARISWLRRSEEHTSELQSLRHLVCRLLL